MSTLRYVKIKKKSEERCRRGAAGKKTGETVTMMTAGNIKARTEI